MRTATPGNQAGKPGGGGACSNLTGGHQKGPPETMLSGLVGVWETVLRAEGEAGAKALKSGDLPKANVKRDQNSGAGISALTAPGAP